MTVKVEQQDPLNVKEWTAAVQTVKTGEDTFASIFGVTIPQEALRVELTVEGAPKCVLGISTKDQDGLVMGEFVKPNLNVDGQVQFEFKENTKEACEGNPYLLDANQPAQFEGTYNDASETLQVLQAQP